MKQSLLLFLAATFLFNCKSEPERILIKLNKGQKYNQHMISTSTSSQTIMGKPMSTTSISDAVNLAEVVDVTDTIYTIKITYVSMSVKMVKDGVAVPTDNNTVAKILDGLKGKEYLTKMSNTGRVIETIGADSLFSKLFSNMPGVPEAFKTAMLKQMAHSYGDKAIKENSQMSTSLYPNKAIKEGDTWTTNRSGGNEIMLPNIESIYTLDKITSSEYLVSMKAKLTFKSTGPGSLPIQYNLNGTMTSNNKIDKKTGMITEIKMKQDILGNIKLNQNASAQGNEPIPMQIKAETIMTNTFIN
ncbi:hypothetical protein ACVWYN_002990 [Pedobacter sp. UYP24]